MNRVLELTQKRAALFDEADALLKKAEAEKRAFTVDEEATIRTKQDEMAAIQRQIDIVNQMEFARTDVDRTRQQGVDAGVRQPAQVHDNAQDKPWADFGEFLQAVRAAEGSERRIDPRLMRAPAGMNEATPSEGGFFVEKDKATEIFKRVYELGAILNRCRTVPIGANSNGLKMNGVDETSRVNGSRWGGVQVYWANEAASVTATQPKWREMELNLNKLFATYYATEELLADTAALGSLVEQAFTEEMTFKAEDAVIRGTGAGQPDGILSASALVTVSKEAGQAAATLKFNNITKMWARMWARSRQSSVWLINQDIEPQLYDLKIEGTNSGVFPAYLPPGGLSGSQYGSLFGRPVIPVEYCSTLGTVGDIILADFSQYLVIRKGGMQAAASMHVKFLTDEMCYRMTMRLDGQPLWNQPLTPYKGSATLSPFVVLETR